MTQLDRHIAAATWVGRTEPVARLQPETTAEIGDLWRILRAHWAWIVGTSAVLGAIALAYGMLTPSLYSATAQILIDPRDKQIVTNDVNPTGVAPDGGLMQVESQARVIESDSVLTRAVIAAGLLKDPDFGGSGNGFLSWTLRTLEGKDAAAPPSEADAEARAVRALRRKLAVKRADKVFVVDVVVTADEPDKAARIVNAIALAYLDDQASARTNAATRASSELSARLEDLRKEVSRAEQKVERFKEENGLLSANGKLLSDQQLAESNNRIVAARARTAEARARLRQIKEARGTPYGADTFPEAIQSSTINRLRAQYAELVSKQSDLRTQLGARHPYIEAVRAQLRDVQLLIDAELNRIVKSATTDYERAAADEAALTNELDTLKKQSIKVNEALVRLREIEREADTSRTVYGNFLSRARELQEQAGIDTANVRVISWARPPQERSWPLRILLLAGGLVGGLGLGAGIAFVREYLDPTILSRQQLERLSGAPVLAHLPVFGPKSERKARAAAALALDRIAGMTGQGLAAEEGLAVYITSGIADASARRAVTRLLAAVAVTRNQHVLIIGADLEAGQAAARPGLVDVLAGRVTLAGAVSPDAASGASRLKVGDTARFSRETGRQAAFERVLAEARTAYDLVLIDGGALAVNLRAVPLVLSADRLVLVVQEGTTRQRDYLDVLEVSGTVAGRLTGSVLVGAGAA